jgi:hypothetical protein
VGLVVAATAVLAVRAFGRVGRLSNTLFGLACLVNLAAAVYVGEVGFGLLVAGVLAWALVVAQLRPARKELSLLAGMVVVLAWLFTASSVLIPAIRSISAVRSIFFTSSKLAFKARDHVFTRSTELHQFWGIVVLLVPLLAALPAMWVIVRTRRAADDRAPLPPVVIPGSLAGAVAAGSVPLVLASWLKLSGPSRLLAPFMSGDGRNFVLFIQQQRVESSYKNILGVVNQGDFGSSIAAMLSKAAGSHGLFQVNDVVALSATYVWSAMLISTAVYCLVVGLARRSRAWAEIQPAARAVLAAVAGGIGFYVAVNPFTMNEVFRSGFFSLYVSLALVAVFLAIWFVAEDEWSDLAQMGCIVIVLYATYQPAALVPLLLLSIRVGPRLWRVVRSRPIVSAAVVLVLLLVLIPGGFLAEFHDRVKGRVTLVGGIVPLSEAFVGVSILIGVGLLAFSQRSVRRIGVSLMVVAVATKAFWHFVAELRADQGLAGYGYYGAKFSYVALFIVVTAAVALLSLALVAVIDQASHGTPRVLHAWPAVGVLVAVLFVGMWRVYEWVSPPCDLLDKAPNGWDYPRAWVVDEVLARWNKEDAVYLQIIDEGNDGSANFWSPLFWSRNARWDWVYEGINYDLDSVCDLMAPGPVAVITASEDYGRLLTSSCPEVIDHYEVVQP